MIKKVIMPLYHREREDFQVEFTELRKSGEGTTLQHWLPDNDYDFSCNYKDTPFSHAIPSPAFVTHYARTTATSPVGRGVKKAAFTLAEILITLMVIGVVAAITVPNLMHNVNQATLSRKQQVFDAKLHEGLRRMKAEDKLEKTYTTSEFIDEMGKYFNISQVCEPENLTDCFGEKIISYEGKPEGEEFNVSELTNTNNFNDAEDSDAPVKGIKFADGTTMIMGYKPNCSAATSFDNDASTENAKMTSCMRYIANTAPGKKSNNYGGSTSADKLEGSTKAEQQASKNSINKGNNLIGNISLTKGNPYGLSFKIVDMAANKTWDEAVAYCQAQGASLPNAKQLTEMANKIYLVEGANCTKSTIQYDPYYYDCNQSVIEVQPLIHYLSSGLIWSNNANGGALGPLYASFGMTSGLVGDNTFVFEQFTAVCVR